MQKFKILGQPLPGEKYVTQKEERKKEERRKKNNAKNSGHYVSAATPRAAHALRSDQYRYNQGKHSGLQWSC